jgi:monodehydroascorbate reductase (NADH)
MSTQSFKYVILGAGNAAGYAAREFAARGVGKGEVALIGDEPALPYERPALSKAVLVNDKVRLPGFHTCVGDGGERQTQEWYDDRGVATLLGERVIGVNLAGKVCEIEGGGKVVAEKALILATGADALRLDMLPGSGLDGVVYLRNNKDALDLADRLQACKGKKVVVVGGGYIGCEVAAAAAEVGCEVTMVFPEKVIMPRLFTEEIGVQYEAVFEGMGVKMLKDGRVCKRFIEGAGGKVAGVAICKGDVESEVQGELVVVGVGARPATALFKGGVEMDKAGGVLVDGQMKTSVDGVYAIGDIATFPLKMYGGRPARVEHVGHARSSAAQAVRAACGVEQEAYDYLPFFYSRAGSQISWKYFGDSEGECVVVGDFKSKLAAFWVNGGKCVGVLCEKPTEEDSEVMKKIALTQPATDAGTIREAGTADAVFALLSA